ncbi:MAG: DNA polymerase III subunit delta [Candidatus Wildermuthbacteria bacterium RIFCSPLOWO2_02_FULL_47_9c]|uniref:DNA polymerase III subunit delta n=2 Tax=Parcubacteria group TaxID=1794811 RepID=A0A837IPG5_9BACT|nr:MAG: polymerase III, delta subunit protein [Candidatus Yanofskybacteria bacterium GW2011_GWC1_48_11]KKW03954.1 MAG: polymerase III, delta subunit protein [Parcubacteria group bacterium GW2011_GWB1_49_12]KKW08700.1 MAG: polymerase III, delta subunit protein [Parcubacteria group bacterium GW2011_GWA1_49_26]KKW13960.1 MAG: polymerase III, delta subunit protein [Parcubacteria group bacterium GW2011_GWA2_50_10]OHA61649.1 MAG: DNA polymerase III subunit delta [Candidatus Wildermuthbacteria bacteri
MIFFLHGPDTYRARQKLKEIREKYQATYLHAVNVQDFDCAETEIQEAKNALSTISMFEQKKLLIFKNVFGNKAFEDFLFAQRVQLERSDEIVVVVFGAGTVKEKGVHPLYQWLKKNARQQEFLPISPSKLKLWIVREFACYNLKATLVAQEALAQAVGNDLWRLSNEVKKIAAWKSGARASISDSGRVKESDVTLFLSVDEEADVFSTVEAVAAKNKKRALSFLYRHLQKGDSPAYLLSMLHYQFRTILQIQDMREKGFSQGAILQKTKLHPYVLKKGLQLAQTFSLPELKAIYERLFTAEKNIKTGAREPEAVLDLLVATL